MNKIFKTIWSRTQNRIVVVDETKGSFGKGKKAGSTSNTQSHNLVKAILASALSLALADMAYTATFPNLDSLLSDASVGKTVTNDSGLSSPISGSATGTKGAAGSVGRAGVKGSTGSTGTAGENGVIFHDWQALIEVPRDTLWDYVMKGGDYWDPVRNFLSSYSGISGVQKQTGQVNVGMLTIPLTSNVYRYATSGGQGGKGGNGGSASSGGTGNTGKTGIGILFNNTGQHFVIDEQVSGTATGGQGGMGGKGGSGGAGGDGGAGGAGGKSSVIGFRFWHSDENAKLTSDIYYFDINTGKNYVINERTGQYFSDVPADILSKLKQFAQDLIAYAQRQGWNVTLTDAASGAQGASGSQGAGGSGGKGGNGGDGIGVAINNDRSIGSVMVFNNTVYGHGIGGDGGSGGSGGSGSSTGSSGSSGSRGNGYGVFIDSEKATYFNDTVTGKAEGVDRYAVFGEVSDGGILAFSGEVKSEGGKLQFNNDDANLFFSDKVPDFGTAGGGITMTGDSAVTTFDFGNYDWENGMNSAFVIGIDAKAKQEAVEKFSDVLKGILPEITNGDFDKVRQDIEKGLDFKDGTVRLRNLSITEEQKQALLQKFKEKFPSIELVFDEGVSFSKGKFFDTDTVNALYDSSTDFQNVTFTGLELDGVGDSVIIGNTDHGLKHSTGFVGIVNAKAVTIRDNLNLELIGKDGQKDYDMTSGIPITVTKGSLTLGSKGVGETYGGKLKRVDLTGAGTVLHVADGTYSVGILNFGDTSTANITDGNFTAESITTGQSVTLNNAGSTHLGTTTASFSSIGNNGLLFLDNGQYTINVLKGEGFFSVAKEVNATLADATQANQQNISNAGTLNIKTDYTTGGFSNTGTVVFDKKLSYSEDSKLKQNGAEAVAQFVDPSNVLDLLTMAEPYFELVDVERADKQDVRSQFSETFQLGLKGLLNPEFETHAELNGGVIKVENAVAAPAEQQSYKDTFASRFGNEVTLEFINPTDSGRRPDVLSVAKTNEMYENEEGFRDVTFVNEALKGQNTDVVVGDQEGNLKHSTGFKGVENANSITVNDGKSLELVGTKGEDSNYFMTAVKTVVNAASKLIFGSKAFSDTYSGKAKEVELSAPNATLLVAAGIYETEKVTGSGKVDIDDGAKLTVNGAQHTGQADIGGTLQAKGEGAIGEATLENASSLFTVAGTYDAQKVSGEGIIEVQEAGKLTLKAAEHTGRANLDGTLEAQGTGSIGDAMLGANGLLHATTGSRYDIQKVGGAGAMEVDGDTTLTIEGADHTGRAMVSGTLVANGSGKIGNTNLVNESSLLNVFGTYEATGITGSGKIDIDSAASLTVDSGEHTGIASVKGTLFTNGTGKLGDTTLEDDSMIHALTGTYEVAKLTGSGGMEIDAGASLIIDNAEHTGSSTINGTLQTKENVNLGTVNFGSGGELANSGNLHITKLESTEGAIYRQTGGNLVTDEGWFTDATIYFSGGTIDMDNIAAGAYSESGLGNNTIVLSGNKGNPTLHTEDSMADKANWKDGLTLLKTDVLKSETKITVERGGVLWAEKLEFDGVTENSLVLNGGALETKLDQIFDDVVRDYLDLDAEDEGGQDHQPTHVIGATSIGNIKDSVKKGVLGNSGIIVFNDEYVKMEGIIKAMLHFAQEASHPGSQESGHADIPLSTDNGVYLAFSGNVDAKLTVDLANSFSTEQVGENHVRGVVLSHTRLYNKSKSDPDGGNTDLVIGYNEHNHEHSNVIDVDIGIGFLSIEEADVVHIEEGKELVLTGPHDDNEIRTDEQRAHVHAVDDSVLFNEDTALIHNDKNDGGKVEVTGKFVFGSFAAHTHTVGWIGEIEIHEGGQVESENGEYAVWNIENEGNIRVDNGTILHSHNYSGTGNWVNEGQIYLSDDHKEHSQLESSDFEIKGRFENHAGAILDTEGKPNLIVDNEMDNAGLGLYSVFTVNEGGVSKTSGQETGNEIDVKAGGKHTVQSGGVSIFKKAIVEGVVENSGSMTLGIDGNPYHTEEEGLARAEEHDPADELAFEVKENALFSNKGSLDATAITDTNIYGNLANSGQAQYAHLVLHGGSTTTNSGITNAREINVDHDALLTVEGAGTSVYTKATVNGKVTNSGTMIIGVDLTPPPVQGEENPPAQQSGESASTEQGSPQGPQDSASLPENDLAKSQSANNELPLGDSEDEFSNGAGEDGDHSDADPDGEGETDVRSTKFDVEEDGEFENAGALDATRVETTNVRGILTNSGKAHYNGMLIAANAKVKTTGTEVGELLTIEGEEENAGQAQWKSIVVNANGKALNTGTLIAEAMTVNTEGTATNQGQAKITTLTDEGGIITLEGQTEISELVLNTGTTYIKGGQTVISNITFNGASLVIGNDASGGADNAVRVATMTASPIGTQVKIGNNGDMYFGELAPLMVEDFLAKGFSYDGPRLTVSGHLSTAATGSLAVGGTQASEAPELGNGSLFFEKDSMTIILADDAMESAIFTTDSPSATLTVEPGAQLVVSGLEAPGIYYITEGFANESASGDTWNGGWTGGDLYAVAEGTLARLWNLTLHHDADSTWLEAKINDIRQVFPDVALPNNSNDDLNNYCRNPQAGADAKFLCGVLNDPNLTDDEKQRIVNSVGNLGSVGGQMYVAFNDVNAATDSGENRASAMSEVFGKDGTYRHDDTLGNTLWVDVLGGWQRSSHMKATGISYGYKSHSYGVILGYDHAFYDNNLIVGAALSFDKGKLDSTGRALATNNKFKTYGAQVYGGWKPIEYLNVLGSLGFFRSQSDISMALGGAAGFSKAEGDAKTNLFVASARLETPLVTDGYGTLVHHFGLRYVLGKTGDYWTKLDGQKAFHNRNKATSTVQIPIGIGYRQDFLFDSGWIIRPKLDLAVIPQFGNIKQKTKVVGITNAIEDTVNGEFTGHIGYSAKVGIQADKKDWTVGINYGYTGGDKGRSDHSVKLEARWRF